MTLDEYNKQGSRETFCYMLEYGTRSLGNISGVAGAQKFEIYERKIKTKIPNGYWSDDEYTWRTRAGETREDAFKYTKDIIVEIIESAQAGNFRNIDGKKLAPLVVWKIAFIYSKKRILPISDRVAVRTLAYLFGHKKANIVRLSSLHEFLMPQVSKMNFWADVDLLWLLYRGHRAFLDGITPDSIIQQKGTTRKNIQDSVVLLGAKQMLIMKKHNILQQDVYEHFVSRFGRENVSMEGGFIDLRVEHPDSVDFYEVKITSSAMYCIREALGQLLEYSYKDHTKKKKRLFIIGNHEADESVLKYVDFLNQNLIGIELNYMGQKTVFT